MHLHFLLTVFLLLLGGVYGQENETNETTTSETQPNGLFFNAAASLGDGYYNSEKYFELGWDRDGSSAALGGKWRGIVSPKPSSNSLGALSMTLILLASLAATVILRVAVWLLWERRRAAPKTRRVRKVRKLKVRGSGNAREAEKAAGKGINKFEVADRTITVSEENVVLRST